MHSICYTNNGWFFWFFPSLLPTPRFHFVVKYPSVPQSSPTEPQESSENSQVPRDRAVRRNHPKHLLMGGRICGLWTTDLKSPFLGQPAHPEFKQRVLSLAKHMPTHKKKEHLLEMLKTALRKKEKVKGGMSLWQRGGWRKVRDSSGLFRKLSWKGPKMTHGGTEFTLSIRLW